MRGANFFGVLLLSVVAHEEAAARLAAVQTDWSDPGACSCLTCDGQATDDSETAACAGRTSGCSADDEHSGCYGKNKNSPFLKGTCICGSGQFMQPEVYHVGGTVSGIPDGLALVLSNTSPKKEGPTFTGDRAVTLTQPITWNGAWYFNDKFASDQEYNINVYRVPKGTTCKVHGSKKGRVSNDVINLHVTCTKVGGRSDVATIPRSLPRGASSNEAKELKEAKSHMCEDSAKLTPAGRRSAFKHTTTFVPCNRHFSSRINMRDYMTEVRGHKCVDFSVKLSDPGTVCFVPERIWNSLGRSAVLSDAHLCPCKNARSCTKRMKLSPTATYLLYVTPKSNDGTAKFDVSLTSCHGGLSKTKVLCAAGFVGLLAIIALSDKSGSKGRKKGYAKISRMQGL